MHDDDLKAWFLSEVLPLERPLLAYVRQHWRAADEARDIVHDVYEMALEEAAKALPFHTQAYVFTIARNLMASRARRARIVSFELVSDLDSIPWDHELLTPYRHASARDELKRVMEGMDSLPPRCREMVRLRKIEELSIRQIADRLDVSVKAVERQLTAGMRAIARMLREGGEWADSVSPENPSISGLGGSHE